MYDPRTHNHSGTRIGIRLSFVLNPKKCESSFFSTDPDRATFQSPAIELNLLGFPLLFNPTPKFLGKTFNRTLSFWGPFTIPVFQILSTPQSPSLHSHCLLGSHKRISLPTLQSLCTSGAHICLSWMVPIPLQHRYQSLGISTQSCMQGHYWVPLSYPSSLLLFEAQLPPVKLTLEHQTFYSFKSARRLPPDLFSLYALATRNVPCRLKKKPSWRSYCSSVT